MTRDTAIVAYNEYKAWIFRNNRKDCHRNWVLFTKSGYFAIRNEQGVSV